MNQLSIREIHESYNKRSEAKTKSFDKVLEDCYKKIRRTVDSKRFLFVFYEVPQVVLGHPLYNINDCITYIKDHLSSKGFLTKYYFPNIIYVSWNEDEILQNKMQSEMQTITHINRMLMSDSVAKPKPKQGKQAKSKASKKVVINLS